MLNAMEPKYILGLAACFHMLKEYFNAIQTYTMCSALDLQNPILPPLVRLLYSNERVFVCHDLP